MDSSNWATNLTMDYFRFIQVLCNTNNQIHTMIILEVRSITIWIVGTKEEVHWHLSSPSIVITILRLFYNKLVIVFLNYITSFLTSRVTGQQDQIHSQPSVAHFNYDWKVPSYPSSNNQDFFRNESLWKSHGSNSNNQLQPSSMLTPWNLSQTVHWKN